MFNSGVMRRRKPFFICHSCENGDESTRGRSINEVEVSIYFRSGRRRSPSVAVNQTSGFVTTRSMTTPDRVYLSLEYSNPVKKSK